LGNCSTHRRSSLDNQRLGSAARSQRPLGL
jgi:hypothetical protein